MLDLGAELIHLEQGLDRARPEVIVSPIDKGTASVHTVEL